jgi:nitroimidazol reductase NimA-like FMN-containing flavoprotein (pyridoxamine 5'-phosphate oxidase superfamily)
MLTERTRVRRRAARGSHDPALNHAILDAALVCHVGFVVEGQPYVIPTAHARVGDWLYVHGAPANRMLGALSAGVPCCVTATLVDGLVLARSAFHHSMNYRSVVVLGTATQVTNTAEKRAALHALVERLHAGRSRGCRSPTDGELAATSLLALPITEASVKVRTGPPIDDADDLALPHWAGVIPTTLTRGAPEPDPLLLAGTLGP